MREQILALVDEIQDPCSLAQGVPAGLVAMGLVKRLEIDGGRVALTLRLTSPGCFYGIAFERMIRECLESLPEVAELALDWDREWDWEPGAMAPRVREELARRRRLLLAAHATR